MRYLHIVFVTLILCLTLGGCMHLGSGPALEATEYNNDAIIKARVSKVLADSDPKKAENISVHSYLNHVFLVGVADEKFRNLAVSLAKADKSVKSVTTHWVVVTKREPMEDAVISAEVDSKLFLDSKIRSSRMAVDVFGGHVVLTGLMEEEKNIEKAIDIARSAENVKSVVSYLSLL